MDLVNYRAFGHSDALIRVCRHCNGDGQVFGFTSINPSQKEHWLECSECGGSGEIATEIEEEENEE